MQSLRHRIFDLKRRARSLAREARVSSDFASMARLQRRANALAHKAMAMENSLRRNVK